MKFEVSRGNDLFWALCKIVGKEEEKALKVLENAEKNENGYIFNIELKIDGVDFNFGSIITGLLQRQDEEVKRQVQNVLESKFLDIVNQANEIIEDLDGISETLDFQKNYDKL